MNKDLFTELTESIKEAGKISRKKTKATRTFEYEAPDVRHIRERLGFSQSQFALLIGVPVSTLQNWEQGRRKPHGPAAALLKIADSDPETVLKALHS